MNKLQKRLMLLDKKAKQVAPSGRQFFDYIGGPWTPEQKADAIKRFPNT